MTRSDYSTRESAAVKIMPWPLIIDAVLYYDDWQGSHHGYRRHERQG